MPFLQRKRQRKRSRDDVQSAPGVSRQRPAHLAHRIPVREAVQTLLWTGQSNRHAAWRLDRQQRAIGGRHYLLRQLLKQLLTLLDGRGAPEAISWTIPEDAVAAINIVRLVDKTFDEHADEMRWKYGLMWQGVPLSSQRMVYLLVQKCGFVLLAQHNVPQQQQQQQHQQLPPVTNDNDTQSFLTADVSSPPLLPPPITTTMTTTTTTTTTTTIYELSHEYFCPGRVDLIARIRFFRRRTGLIRQLPVRQQQDNDDDDDVVGVDAAAATTTSSTRQWPLVGAVRGVAAVHLADERQYQSLLHHHPDKLWPEPFSNHDDDDDDDDDESIVLDDDTDNASLDDDELDATWDQEVSDGIDPIQFSADQLTQVLPSHPASIRAARQLRHDGCGGDGGGDDDHDHDASLERSRTLLLQSCWERAVHMASSTFTVQTNGNETNVEQQQQPQRQRQQQQSSSRGNPTIPPPPSLIRTRSMAEQTCQQWNLQPQHEYSSTNTNITNTTNSSDHGKQYFCSVCANVYGSYERLADHFYGTTSSTTTTGCCWIGIAYARRTFIRTILSNEVDTQRRLLLQVLLLSSNPPCTSNDALGVLDTLEGTFRNSQVVTVPSSLSSSSSSSTSTRPVASETLQLSSHLPPLMLNQDVLESARHRIVDRYTTVRR